MGAYDFAEYDNTILHNGMLPFCRMSCFHSAEWHQAILQNGSMPLCRMTCPLLMFQCRNASRKMATMRCLGRNLRSCAASSNSKLLRATCRSIKTGVHRRGTACSPGPGWCVLNSARCMPSERAPITTRQTSVGLANSRCRGGSRAYRLCMLASLARSRCTRRRGKAVLA